MHKVDTTIIVQYTKQTSKARLLPPCLRRCPYNNAPLATQHMALTYPSFATLACHAIICHGLTNVQSYHALLRKTLSVEIVLLIPFKTETATVFHQTHD